MVHPDIVRPEDVNGISVCFASASVMGRRAPYVGRSGGLTVVNVNVVNDDVVHILNRKARSSSDVHIVTTTVESLETVHDELLFELYVHVAAKHNPEWLGLNDAIAECPFLGVNHVVVAVISDYIYFSVFTTDGVLAKAKGAICELLPILGPVCIAPPTVVDGVAGSATSKSSSGRIRASITTTDTLCQARVIRTTDCTKLLALTEAPYLEK